MKTINETFTDEEFAKLMRIKKFLPKMSWHDILLRAFETAEVDIKKKLLEEGTTQEEIDEMFPIGNKLRLPKEEMT